MANENATISKSKKHESLDFDELERQLQESLDEQMADLDFLDEQKEQIGDPDALGNVILNTVWEQFTNQIAIQAGEDFIKDNNMLKLDLSNDAHIQTTDNFEYGKLATHNTNTDYKEKYDKYMGQFKTDPNEEYKYKNSKNHKYDEKTKTWSYYNEKKGIWEPKERYNDKKGVWESYDKIDGEWKKKIKDNSVRKPYDEGRPVGKNGNHEDHQVSAGEIIRDPSANAFMSEKERVDFAISDKNLNELDSSANESKNDHNGEKWAKHEREKGSQGEGQTNAEFFGLDEDEYVEKDRKARKEYEKLKNDAEERARVEGKKSQKAETLRVGKKAARAVVMTLLAELIKKIIAKFILWLKSAKRNLKSLLKYVKDAIVTFVLDLKNNVVNVANTAVTVIAMSILGPVVNTIKKAWMFIKQGWMSLKKSIEYIKDPRNKNKPIGILMMEVGKIIIAGLTAGGTIVLGEVIEKGLITIPLFAVEIPLFGSLASIIGMFMGAIVLGIIGALAINLINSLIAKKQKAQLTKEKIEKGNEILTTQDKIRDVAIAKTDKAKEDVINSISKRHMEASEVLRDALETIKENGETDYEDIDHSEEIAEMDQRIRKLLEE